MKMNEIVHNWLIRKGLLDSVNQDQKDTLEAFGDYVIKVDRVTGPLALSLRTERAIDQLAQTYASAGMTFVADELRALIEKK